MSVTERLKVRRVQPQGGTQSDGRKGMESRLRQDPTTLATLYGWGWITREKHWIEGLAALTVTEWTNDDRLLADQGGAFESDGEKVDGRVGSHDGGTTAIQGSWSSG